MIAYKFKGVLAFGTFTLFYVGSLLPKCCEGFTPLHRLSGHRTPILRDHGSALLLSAKNQRRGKGKAKARLLEPIYPPHEDMPSILPKLLVFDLDNTLWTPELYQIRQRSVPKAGKEIWLFQCAESIVSDLATNPAWSSAGTQMAIASRTNKGEWADKLLRKFEASPGVTLDELFVHKEIVQGSKRQHFESLREKTGVRFGDMVFFDDDFHMNLKEISQMGVLCCHCPKGITRDLFRGTLRRYDEMKSQHTDQWMGITLTSAEMGISQEEESKADEGRKTKGRIKFYSSAKRFGFVIEDGDDSGGEFFFHESKIAAGVSVETGMMVEFETLADSKGRPAAAILSEIGENGHGGRKRDGAVRSVASEPPGSRVKRPSKKSSESSSIGESIRMPCFSMSQPFAALLLNGVKTIETRNNPMFMDLKPGTKVLLHCGMRDWNDTEAPRIELRKAGYSEKEIDQLSALPPGFKKGSVVGIVEVGRTWLTAERERRGANMQQRVVASSENVGKYATIIENATWLKRQIKQRGFPGIQMVDVPRSFLPL